MIEGGTIAQIDQKSRIALRDPEWTHKQRLNSSEYVLIRGMVGGEQRGALSASFEIKREFEPSTGELQKLDRSVKLKSVSVWPAYQRGGLGIAMLDELERQAGQFGASRITGIVSSKEYEEKPWLKEYYEKRGFEVSPIGEGWKLVKDLK